MTATTQATDPRVEVRSLEKTDLDAVVALDGRNVGRSRRGYFERRLASALRDPKSHLQLAAVGPSGLEGFALARVTSGEYGRPEPAVLLEAVEVEPSRQQAGIGRRMLGALTAKAAARGIGTVVTEVDWRNHAMLQYLAGVGFTLAPRLLLDRVRHPHAPARDRRGHRARPAPHPPPARQRFRRRRSHRPARDRARPLRLLPSQVRRGAARVGDRGLPGDRGRRLRGRLRDGARGSRRLRARRANRHARDARREPFIFTQRATGATCSRR